MVRRSSMDLPSYKMGKFFLSQRMSVLLIAKTFLLHSENVKKHSNQSIAYIKHIVLYNVRHIYPITNQ